jgi:hypothetical protein
MACSRSAGPARAATKCWCPSRGLPAQGNVACARGAGRLSLHESVGWQPDVDHAAARDQQDARSASIRRTHRRRAAPARLGDRHARADATSGSSPTKATKASSRGRAPGIAALRACAIAHSALRSAGMR